MGWHHPHHHHLHHRRMMMRRRLRRMGPIGRYVRAKLRRRVFVWFLSSLMITGGLMFGLATAVAKLDQSDWSSTWERGREWFGLQFAPTWSTPSARESYARTTAHMLGADLELLDPQRTLLFSTGAPCHRPMLEAPVRSGAQLLGSVKVCMQGSGRGGWRFFLFLGAALSAVWMVSGGIARRLARPLDELAEVVRRIGQGDWKARAELSATEPDEIGIVAVAVNDMAARIEKQLAEHRELLATVSHELRTPLARLRLISEIARETGASPKTYDDLEQEIAQMDAMVGELLASSKLEFGQLTLRTLSIRDVAQSAVERAGLPPTTLAVLGEGDVLNADPTLIQRALANLFDNAKKHAGGVEALEVTVEPAAVRFEVLDRGPGIDGDPSVLFEKFNRGQRGEGPDGLGLGLALVRRIALAHGGTAWAQNREGGGARIGFSVSPGLSS